jgi:predicted RNase H-like HicB family nuclease
MKYLKSFRLFEADNSSWSIKNSFTADIFGKIFGSFGFGIKSRKLKNIAKEYDDYLQVVYESYLKDRHVNGENQLPNKPNKPTPIGLSPNQEPINPTDEKDNNLEFSDLGLDVSEIEGLLKQAQSAEEVEKLLNKLKDLAVETEKDMDELLDKISKGEEDENKTLSDRASKLKDKLDRINKITSTVKPRLSTVSHFESVNWLGGAIEAPEDWSDEDKKNITSRVNPYKIEEFSLRKRGIIDAEEDNKKAKKLEQSWSLLLNDIHKKWFYIYEITKLDDKYKSTAKKESPAALKSAKTLEVLKSSFNESSQLVHSAHFIGQKKGYYVLSNFNDELILLYKIEGPNKLFKVVGSMGISENKSKIDYFDSDNSVFVWNVNTNKYRDFTKDTYIQSSEIMGLKYKIRMSSSLGKDYPCIEITDNAGYFNISGFYKEGNDIKRSTISVRQVPFSLYNVNETQHIDVKEPIHNISDELKKSI